MYTCFLCMPTEKKYTAALQEKNGSTLAARVFMGRIFSHPTEEIVEHYALVSKNKV